MKRVWSLLLVVCIMLGMIPSAILADEMENAKPVIITVPVETVEGEIPAENVGEGEEIPNEDKEEEEPSDDNAGEGEDVSDEEDTTEGEETPDEEESDGEKEADEEESNGEDIPDGEEETPDKDVKDEEEIPAETPVEETPENTGDLWADTLEGMYSLRGLSLTRGAEDDEVIVTSEDELDAAIAAKAAKITMGADFSIHERKTIQYTLTFDLAGHILTQTSSQRVFYVPNGGSVTLEDSNPTATHEDDTYPAGGVVTKAKNLGGVDGFAYIEGGYFELNGGTIYQFGGAYGCEGGAFYIGWTSSGMLIINGGVIDGCIGNSGGGAVNIKGGTLNMKGGIIRNCLTYYYGGAIRSSANVTISGGLIENCKDTNHCAGAIYSDGGSLTISGGTIQNCETKTYGGAVFFDVGTGTFTMSGGTIEGCKATSALGASGGGICISKAESAVLSGGTVENCSAVSCGGGVYIATRSTVVTVQGITIKNCNAVNGGGIYNQTIDFKMESGSIIGCIATQSGGGVYNDYPFVMNGGTIQDCTATWGAGVYNNRNRTFTMNNGTITGCDASDHGGGVCTYGEFTMNGGEIKDCTAVNYGDAICNHYTANVNGGEVLGGVSGTIGGTAPRYTVTFNSKNGAGNQEVVYFPGSKISEPTDPERTGFEFQGWYCNGTEWNFATGTVAGDMTLTAKWQGPWDNEEDLSDAVADGGDVTLGGNITLTEPLEVTGDVNLNLNGNTLSGNDTLDIKNGGSLSVLGEGAIGGNVSNEGTISSGNFAGNITGGGTISGGNYTGNVDVDAGGKITSGTFGGNVSNEGSISDGTFTGDVTNGGTISGGNFTGTGKVDVEAGGGITGGTFGGDVSNEGNISDGTFTGDVINNGTITGGTFTGTVTGTGTIAESAKVTVYFDNNIPTKPRVVYTWQKVLRGQRATEEAAPERSGYRFEDWYVAEQGVPSAQKFDFTSSVTEEIVLIATWTDVEPPVISGLTDGESYCGGTTFTATDNEGGIAVSVNGVPLTPDADGKYTLAPADGEQTVLVTDGTGNMTTVTVTAPAHSGEGTWIKTDTTHQWKHDCCGTTEAEESHDFQDNTCKDCGYTKPSNNVGGNTGNGSGSSGSGGTGSGSSGSGSSGSGSTGSGSTGSGSTGSGSTGSGSTGSGSTGSGSSGSGSSGSGSSGSGSSGSGSTGSGSTGSGSTGSGSSGSGSSGSGSSGSGSTGSGSTGSGSTGSGSTGSGSFGSGSTGSGSTGSGSTGTGNGTSSGVTTGGNTSGTALPIAPQPENNAKAPVSGEMTDGKNPAEVENKLANAEIVSKTDSTESATAGRNNTDNAEMSDSVKNVSGMTARENKDTSSGKISISSDKVGATTQKAGTTDGLQAVAGEPEVGGSLLLNGTAGNTTEEISGGGKIEWGTSAETENPVEAATMEQKPDEVSVESKTDDKTAEHAEENSVIAGGKAGIRKFWAGKVFWWWLLLLLLLAIATVEHFYYEGVLTEQEENKVRV